MSNEPYIKLLEVSNDKLVIVTFTAMWSGASKILTSSLKQIDIVNDDLALAEFDVESANELFNDLGLSHVPTTILLRDQEIIDLFIGPLSKRKIKEKILKATAQ